MLLEKLASLGLSLGLSDRAIEDEAGIPQGFIAKFRAGGNSSARAEPSRKRLEEWAASRSGPRPKRSKERKEPAAIAGKPEIDERDELVRAVHAADTPELVDDLINRFLEEAIYERLRRADGGDLVIDLLNAKRQNLKLVAEERAAARAGEPVEVRVVWENDWRTGEDEPTPPKSAA